MGSANDCHIAQINQLKVYFQSKLNDRAKCFIKDLPIMVKPKKNHLEEVKIFKGRHRNAIGIGRNNFKSRKQCVEFTTNMQKQSLWKRLWFKSKP